MQKVSSIVFILLSTCTFAYTINTIGNIYDERMQIGNMKKIKLVELNEYLRAKNLERLRERGLSGKRSLALKEFALGIESLNRFVLKEPLRLIHECVFAVLALESEPIDPRL